MSGINWWHLPWKQVSQYSLASVSLVRSTQSGKYSEDEQSNGKKPKGRSVLSISNCSTLIRKTSQDFFLLELFCERLLCLWTISSGVVGLVRDEDVDEVFVVVVVEPVVVFTDPEVESAKEEELGWSCLYSCSCWEFEFRDESGKDGKIRDWETEKI